MTYKQFKAWANDRACDGRWGMNTAMACAGVIELINSKPFWKREKEWQAFNRDWQIVEIFVEPTNEKISSTSADARATRIG